MPNQLPDTKTDGRQQKLIGLMLTNHEKLSIKKLAVIAGYAESYANGPIYQMINKPEFQSKLLSAYRASSTAHLPRLLKITENALNEYEKEPRLVIEKPAFIQNVRRDVGLATDEPAGKVQVVNIGTVNVLSQALRQLYSTPQEAEYEEME